MKYNNLKTVEIWFRKKPNANDYLKKFNFLAFLATKLITTRGNYYHVEFVYNGYAYSSTTKAGVRKIHISQLNKEEYDIFYATRVDVPIAIKRFEYIEGLPYDAKGIFLSQFFPINKHNEKAYFCSEVVAFMLGMSEPNWYGVNILIPVLVDREKYINLGR